MTEPAQFCTSLPTQPLRWSASALRTFQECPRKHYYRKVLGAHRSGDEESVHTEFGHLYHHYTEQFDNLLLDGTPKDDATFLVFTAALVETVGCLQTSYLPCWRCTSPALIIGPRSGKPTSNRKRCALAKGNQLEGHRGGDPCPDCGLPTVDDWEMIAVDKNKNRDTLLRTVLHYCDTADDRVVPWKFPGEKGLKATELEFSFPLPLASPDWEKCDACEGRGSVWLEPGISTSCTLCNSTGRIYKPYLLHGFLDGLIQVGEEVIPRERKTTKNTLGSYFFRRYEPDTQVDTYDLACWLMYSDLLDPKPHGVLIEVTQVTANKTEIQRQIIQVPEERRAETLQEILWWIKLAEKCARDGYWPKNTSACNANGGCPYRSICKLAPSSRDRFLQSGEEWEIRARE